MGVAVAVLDWLDDAIVIPRRGADERVTFREPCRSSSPDVLGVRDEELASFFDSRMGTSAFDRADIWNFQATANGFRRSGYAGR